MHRRRQLAAVGRERPLAEDVARLPHEHGEQERVGCVGVGGGGEDRGPLAGVAERVESHVVGREDVLELLGGQGRQARVARDDDRLEGLARGGLERPVAPERVVGVGRRWVAPGDPAHGLPRPSHGAAVAAGGAGRGDAAAPGLELAEEHVERAHERLVLVAGLRERQQRHEAGQRPVLGRAVVGEVADERAVEQALRVLPEGVVGRLPLGRGVHDEALDELEHVLLRADVGERVVAHGEREVDGVEGAHVVAVGGEHRAEPADGRSLGVGHEVARVHLHEVGLDVGAGLARARAAYHHDVAVALPARVVVVARHGEADVLGEQDVVVGARLVGEAPQLPGRGPAGAAVLLA